MFLLIYFDILVVELSLFSKFLFFSFFGRHSCLRAIRQLQKNGHIPSDASLFKSYAKYGHFVDVRVAALDALVDYTRGVCVCREWGVNSGSISVNVINHH